MVIFSERLTQALERVKTFYERLVQAVRTGEDFFWTGAQAVRTDGDFSERVPKLPERMTLAVRTANKRLVNGIPFQTGTRLLTFSRERSQLCCSYNLLVSEILSKFENKVQLFTNATKSINEGVCGIRP